MLADDLPSGPIKYLAATLFTGLALNGLLLNSLWALVLFMGHRHFSRRPFYIISRHLLVCDLLCITAQVVVAVPLTIMEYHTAWHYKRTLIFNVFSTFETVGHLSTLTFVFLQALSQIAPFLPNNKSIIYHLSASGTVICMFGWMFNIGMMVAMLFTKCRKDFNLFDFHFYYVCNENKQTARNIWIGLNLVVFFVIGSACLIYGSGYRKAVNEIRAIEAEPTLSGDRKRELVEAGKRRLIIIQGLLIVFMLTLRTLANYVIMPLLTNLGRDMHTVVSMLTNCVEMVSSSVHPCIYIYFNERAHKYFLKIVRVLKNAGRPLVTEETEISRFDK